MTRGLTPQQIEQFHTDGYLIVRDVLPPAAIRPLVKELEEKVDQLVHQAIAKGLLNEGDKFTEAPFEQRLALVCNACIDRNWIWRGIQAGKYKSPGMFTLRAAPALLDIVESLIGPEILAHPQYALRAKMPNHEETVVPWHQDLGYLVPKDAGETLVVNCWVPLVEATAANGCMQVIQGSHKMGYFPHQQLIENQAHTARKGIAEADLPEGEIVTCEVAAGDVLLTMERGIHRSTPNTSDTVRWSVDTRYSQIGLPTGRNDVPGFIARSQANPGQVAKSYEDWVQIFTEAGVALSR